MADKLKDPLAHKTQVQCVTAECNKMPALLYQTNEDEEIVQYDGVCLLCTKQYHLIFDKEEV